MRIHKQSIYRTNPKTNIGNDGILDGLVNYDAHKQLRVASYEFGKLLS
jgi:hypothetical protein